MMIKQIIAGLLVFGAVLWVAADAGPSRDFIYVDAALGNDYWERGSYEEPFETLQCAIEHSVSNSVIFVRAGSYGEVELSDHPVRLVALDGALQTTLEHCTVHAGAGGSAVAGFTITGGNGVSSRNEWGYEIKVGGGLYTEGSLTVSDCVLSDNGSWNVERGGALYATGTNVTVLISNCLIKGNRAHEGPAVYLAKPLDGDSGRNSLILRNCTVYGNGDYWNEDGVSAVAFKDGCSITIDRSILSDNWCYQLGCVDSDWNYPPVEILRSYVQGEESGVRANLENSDELIRTSPEFFSDGEYDFGLSVNGGEYEGVGCDFHAFEAPSAVDESDYDYEIQESGGVVIVQASSNVVGHVVLPSMLGGRPVVGIRGKDKRVFLRAEAVESIAFPRYCAEISEYSFAECSALKEIEIPEGIVFIGDEVFSHCKSLGRISLPKSLRKIGRYAFRWCEKCYFEVPDENPYFSIDAVGCLYDKEKKTLLRLSGGGDSSTLHLKLWGNGWNLPQGLECIANGAATGYGETEWGTNFTIPATVTNIAYDAFGDCRGVRADIDSSNPNYATNDREAIFSKDYGTLFNYRGSGRYTIPSSVTNIAYEAFAYNRTITSAAIPDSVASIGEYAFFRCTGLRSVVLSRNVEVWNTVFAECDVLEHVDFPAGCKAKYLYNWLFYGCSNLTSVILSEGIEYIGYSVFGNCTRLPELTVPESVKTFVPGRLLSLTNFQFRGLPPGNEYGPFIIDTPLATGYYRPKYATEWESVIKSDGTWRGIPMECRPMTNVVRFVTGDHAKRTGGGVLVQSVLDCTDAVAPELSVSRGWRFAGWDVAFTNINSDVTVHAVCEPFIGDPNEAAGLCGPSNAFSYVGLYDGVAHGIAVALEDPPEGLAVRYAAEEAGPFSENAILFRDVCTETPVWYELSAPGFAPVTNWATVTITPKPLTVKADAKSQIYGAAAEALTYATTGLVAGDALSGALVREPGEGVGTYAILQGTLANANYVISYVGANYVIRERIYENGGVVIDPSDSGWEVVLTNDVDRLRFPDNLGTVAIKLNGHGVYGADEDTYGALPPAVEIYPVAEDGPPTILKVLGDGCVCGGSIIRLARRPDAWGTAGDGICVDGNVRDGVAVSIESGVVVQGGGGMATNHGGYGIRGRVLENSGTVIGGDGAEAGAGVMGTVLRNSGTIRGGGNSLASMSSDPGAPGVMGTVGCNTGLIAGGDGDDAALVTGISGNLWAGTSASVAGVVTGEWGNNVVYLPENLTDDEIFDLAAQNTNSVLCAYDKGGHSLTVRTYEMFESSVQYALSRSGPYASDSPQFTDVTNAVIWYVHQSALFEPAVTNVALLSIVKGVISAEDEEPGEGAVPAGGFSKFDTTFVYDGAGHTINTNALSAAFKAALGADSFAVSYARGGVDAPAGSWEPISPSYTEVGEYVVWYKVASPNYEDFVHRAKVKVTEAYKPLVVRCEWREGAIAPASMDFKVLANGVDCQTLTLTASEGWKKKVDVLVYDQKVPVEYSIEPVSTTGIRSEVSAYGCCSFGSCTLNSQVLTESGWSKLGPLTPSSVVYTTDGWTTLGAMSVARDVVTDTQKAGVFFLVENYKATFDIDDGTDGEGGKASKFSSAGVYDGQGHGINVKIADPPAGTTVKYACGQPDKAPGGTWSTVKPLYTNVCDNVVWYAVECAGYVSYTNNATVTITPKPLAVKAQAAGKVFGTADPVLPYSTEGLVGADALTGALTRAPGEAVGTYAILQGTLAAGPNYALDFTGATFTISQTPIIGPFEPAEPDIDPETGLVVVRILDNQGPIVIPDNLGPFILNLNGHSITGVCGSAESGTFDGGPALTIVHVDGGEGTGLIIRNSDPEGRGGIFGGDGANGTAEHPAGGNGGLGILIEDTAVAPSVTVEENVLVRGGRGGNGYAGSGADGGNGGAGIEDRTTEPDDSTIVNGGTIEGGDGGNGADGADGAGDTPGGNGGNGGAGVDGDVDDNTGTITGGNGGDGGDSESGNGGRGGDGGEGVDGDVGDNTGTIADGEDGTTVLTETMVSLAEGPWIYAGTAIKPMVTVTSGGTALVEGVDFAVTYLHNINAGTATAVITGLGSCEGTVTKMFAISPRSFTDEMVQPGEDAFFFDGDAKKPTVDVIHEVDGLDICTESDYELVYGEKAAAGWWVTVTGKGNYAGTVTKIVPVLKRPVTPPVVTPKAYNGKTQKPTIPTDSRWTVVANPGGINVGEYTNVVLRLTNTTDYKWKGGTEEATDITLVFAVTKANNGWSRYPAMSGWEYGQTPSEPNLGQARYGTVQVAYRKAGADVSTETATRPELPGQYIARFYVEALANYIGVTRDVAFEITGTAPDDPVDPPPELPEKVTALISMAADGTPEIGWTPDLSDNPRIVYTVLGKENLSDAEWTPVTDANKQQMRFFKVRVEVK